MTAAEWSNKYPHLFKLYDRDSRRLFINNDLFEWFREYHTSFILEIDDFDLAHRPDDKAYKLMAFLKTTYTPLERAYYRMETE